MSNNCTKCSKLNILFILKVGLIFCFFMFALFSSPSDRLTCGESMKVELTVFLALTVVQYASITRRISASSNKESSIDFFVLPGYAEGLGAVQGSVGKSGVAIWTWCSGL